MKQRFIVALYLINRRPHQLKKVQHTMKIASVKRYILGVALVGSFVLATTVQAGGSHSPLTASASTADSLYVDNPPPGDNSVQRFDAQTGTYLGAFVPANSTCTDTKPQGSLCGPRGMLYEDNLLVANQNVGLDITGEIDQFSHVDGTSLGALVPYHYVDPNAACPGVNPNAPFAPRGIIRGPDNLTLYVADFGKCNIGRVAKYSVTTCRFLGNLNFSTFIPSDSNPTPGEFHPRGLVFGPDGLLYISLFSETNFSMLGAILSYNLSTGAVRVVASYNPSATDCSTELHHPEGLVFEPDGKLDGKLYVTSFQVDSNDVDRILVFDRATGSCLDEIDLDQVGQPRAFAEALLFGPHGHLFVPITNTGAVRSYNVSNKTFTDFVPAGTLSRPWYLTFGSTNPSTLAYGR